MRRPVLIIFVLMGWTPSLFSQPADSIWQVFSTSHLEDNQLLDSILHFCERNKGKYSSLKLSLLQKVERIATTEADSLQHCRYLLEKSRCHFELEEYLVAQDLAYLALAQQPRDISMERDLYVQIAAIFYALPDYDKSLEYARRAFTLSRKLGDSMEIAAGYNRLGDAFRRLNRRDSALHYLTEAISMREQLGDLQGLAKAYNNLGIYHIRTTPMTTEAHLEALQCWQKSLEYKEVLGDTLGQVFTHVNIAYAGAGPDYDQDKMKVHLDQALALAEAIETKDGLRTVYKAIADWHYRAGHYFLAYTNRLKYEMYQDELIDQEMQERIAELDVAYQTTLKEKEIEVLSLDNKAKSEKLKKQAWMIGSGILMLLLLLVSIFLLRRNARLKLLQKEREAQHATQLHEQELIALKQKQELKMMSALVNGQEQERKRIAQDLHDDLGGMMAAIQLNLNGVEDKDDPEKMIRVMSKARDLVEQAGEGIRRVAHNLMPPSIGRYGLDRALKSMAKELNEQEGQQLAIQYQSHGLDKRLPENMEIHLYRIIQELITNSFKYSRADSMLIDLNVSDENIHLTVEDDGVGIDPDRLKAANGIGLQNVQQRVAALGGSVLFDSSPGQGVSVDIFIQRNGQEHHQTSV